MDSTNPDLTYNPDTNLMSTSTLPAFPIQMRGATALESSLATPDFQHSASSFDAQQVFFVSEGATSPHLRPQVLQIPIQTMDFDEQGLITVETSDEVLMGQATPPLDSEQITTAICRVCGDKGSGYHYSVLSCEGCKGFFKRSVQKNLVYTCKNQAGGLGICPINKATRNSCQHCRYQMCLQIGMKREAVREDRSPGGKQRMKQAPVEEERVMIQDIIEEEKELDAEHQALITQLLNSNPDRIPCTNVSKPPAELTIQEMMQFGYMELKYIIEWAKNVPGFRALRVEDQMALLKSSFMELNTFRLAYRSVGYDNMLRFADGAVLSRSVSEKMGWGTELVNSTLEFADRLKELEVDKTEFSIMNAIILTYPDAIGLIDKSKVIELQTKLLDLLRRYIFSRQSVDVVRFGKILLRLPTLRTVSAKAAERFLSLSLEGMLPLNELVQEMMS